MTDPRLHLRALADALPADSVVPVPVAWLRELLADPAPAQPVQTSANGADEQLLTVQDVADRFGLTTDWLYRHWKAVGGVKLGRKVLRFPAGALSRYLAARGKAP